MRLVLAALSWDPQIRGAAIVFTGIFLLVGSVYLLLATNLGAKLGFVLTVAALSGWMTTMGVVWMVFGIGLKGKEPTWKVQDLVTGEAAQSTFEPLRDFPRGWRPLITGDAELADAQAASDRVLAPSAPAGGHGAESGGGAAEGRKLESPFRSTSDYAILDGYSKGGEKYFLSLRHRPHYAVVQFKPSFFTTTPAGVRAQPDYSGPTTTVVMVRDLGNLRFPPFVFAITSGIIFGVCCYSLHQRDKASWAAKAATPATA